MAHISLTITTPDGDTYTATHDGDFLLAVPLVWENRALELLSGPLYRTPTSVDESDPDERIRIAICQAGQEVFGKAWQPARKHWTAGGPGAVVGDEPADVVY